MPLGPLWDYFAVDYYPVEDLHQIVLRAADLLKMELSDDGALEIARAPEGHAHCHQAVAPYPDFAEVSGFSAVTVIW